MPVTTPCDLIAVATVRGAYGLRGWFRLAPESSPTQSALLQVRNWWLKGPDGAIKPLLIAEARVHGDAIVARPVSGMQREEVDQFKSWTVLLSRNDFPLLAAGEYYWVDLIGCAVVNRSGVPIGTVDSMVDHGAHPILVVNPPNDSAPSQPDAASPSLAPRPPESSGRRDVPVQAPLVRSVADRSVTDRSAAPDFESQILIPFVPAFLDAVDLSARLIRVDWSLD